MPIYIDVRREETMGKVIDFPIIRRQDSDAARLKRIADELDEVIVRHLTEGHVEGSDMAGILAHRLGTLMRHLNDKSQLWDICEKVLKKQAAID